jgi:hypothetical protein
MVLATLLERDFMTLTVMVIVMTKNAAGVAPCTKMTRVLVALINSATYIIMLVLERGVICASVSVVLVRLF